MNHTKISVIVLFVFGMVACQSTEKLVTEKLVTEKLASYGPPFDAEWHKKALQSKRELKKMVYKWTSYEDIVHSANRDIMISELGIKKWSFGLHLLQCTPIDSYNIFYDDLMNWTPDQPIEKIMKLDTSIYKTLISSNKIFFEAYYHDFLNKRPFLTQPICRLGSDYLSDAYFVKKLPIFSISVFKNPAWAHDPLSSDILYVYIEEGVYKCFSGTKYFLLSDYIATLKSRSVKNNGYTR